MKLKFDINIGSTEHFRPSYNTISYNDIHRKIENIDDIKDILIHTLPKRLIYRKASLNIKDLIKYGRDGRFRYTTIRRF